ncbi:hypothetical protein KSS87_004870, partial [Heliosperma pusillum]
MNIVKISDWMPQDESISASHEGVPMSVSLLSRSDPEHQSTLSTKFHAVIELSELGLSIIDHTPEEMLYLSVQNLLVSHSSGLGSGTSRFKLKMRGIQVDNQLPLTPMPVLFRPQRLREEIDYILKFSVTSQSNGSLDLCVYPYIGLHVNLNRFHATETNAVSIDPIIQIGVLDISEVRLKVSMVMSPTQRPKGVLGFWASLMTALGNMENMHCPQQPGSYECGYYVMKGMYDITLHYASSEDDIEKCVSGTEMNTELMNEVRELGSLYCVKNIE